MAHSPKHNTTRSPATQPITDLLGSNAALPDDQLAQLIEEHGWQAIRDGQPPALTSYLKLIGDVEAKPVALDAAIDVVLRSLQSQGMGASQAVATLSSEHPSLEQEIQQAAMLSDTLMSTEEIRAKTRPATFNLPCDFGEHEDSGHQRYQLIESLGAGVTGSVYLAVDRRLSDADHTANVALKVFHNASGGLTVPIGALEEAKKARRVDHPHAVPVFDCDITKDDNEYGVYRYIKGTPLDRWLNERKPSTHDRVAAIRDVAGALAAVHNAGLVHCDLKPSNILVEGARHAWLTDFGHAQRIAPGRSTGSPSTSSAKGNLAFAAPEIAGVTQGPIGPYTDTFSLGALLIFILTEQLPFGSRKEDVLATLQGQRHRKPLETVRNRTDQFLWAICERATSLEPDKRYNQAAELEQDLTDWLDMRPIQWTNPSLRARFNLIDRRQPAAVRTVLISLCVLLLLISVASLMHTRAIQAEAVSAEAALSIEQHRAFIEENFPALMRANEYAAQREANRQEGTSDELTPYTQSPDTPKPDTPKPDTPKPDNQTPHAQLHKLPVAAPAE